MENELKKLGLDVYESRALILLMKEKLNMRQLSDKAKIPFGKVYSVVKNLKNQNLVQETNSRPKLIYVQNASEIITRLIDKKKQKEIKVYEKLKSFAGQCDLWNGEETKFFQIGTNSEDNKKIQLRTFTEAKKEVLQILNIYHKPKSNRENKRSWENAIIQAVERGIIFKAIYPVKMELPKILKKLNKEKPDNFQVKRFDTDFVRCDIIDEDKVLIKLVQQDPLQFGGVFFIENEKMNENLKKIFYEMWD
jgi:sugar-specific transcriptional regulator TrmB